MSTQRYDEQRVQGEEQKRRLYESPRLLHYGTVRQLTNAGSAGAAEGNATNNRNKLRP